MTLEEYMEELYLMEKQYGQEEELYPLINILLRQSGSVAGLSLRDVHKGRLCSNPYRNLLYGISNFPDLVVLDKEFENNTENNTNPQNLLDNLWKKKKYLYGCVEVKKPGEKISSIIENIKIKAVDGSYTFQKKDDENSNNDNEYKEVDQIYGDVLWYEKVIHTDGKKWMLYKISGNNRDNEIIKTNYFSFIANRYGEAKSGNNTPANELKRIYNSESGIKENALNETNPTIKIDIEYIGDLSYTYIRYAKYREKKNTKGENENKSKDEVPFEFLSEDYEKWKYLLSKLASIPWKPKDKETQNKE